MEFYLLSVSSNNFSNTSAVLVFIHHTTCYICKQVDERRFEASLHDDVQCCTGGDVSGHDAENIIILDRKNAVA